MDPARRRRRRAPDGTACPKRGWINPVLRTPAPTLSEQIASLEMAYRFYAMRQEEAVEERNVTPHTAYHNCSNLLHALETLRWLGRNEAAVKAKTQTAGQ
jgi:hypothetical protein